MNSMRPSNCLSGAHGCRHPMATARLAGGGSAQGQPATLMEHSAECGPCTARQTISPACVAPCVAVAAWASAGAAQAVEAAGEVARYVPSAEPLSWEIWAGLVAGVIPFVIASVEFGKRILIQRRCPECAGRGLVQRGRYLRRCGEVRSSLYQVRRLRRMHSCAPLADASPLAPARCSAAGCCRGSGGSSSGLRRRSRATEAR